MTENVRASRLPVNTTTVSIFVAALSLCTAMYQGYLNTQAVAVFSRDVSYRETMRACREVVEHFMEAKLRIARIVDDTGKLEGRERSNEIFDARRSVVRFSAVATYLANFNEKLRREPYTELAREIEALIRNAATSNKAPDFTSVDEKFFALNKDCVAAVK